MNDETISADTTVAILVACPDCGNLNRAARRACKTCNRSGKVVKYV